MKRPRQIPVAVLALSALVLSGCNAEPRKPPADRAASSESKAASPAPPASAAPPPAPIPAELTPGDRALLLEAIAGSELFARVLRNKERTGKVVAPGKERDLAKAERDLATIRERLAALSGDGMPTFALIHTLRGGAAMNAWLIGPDGGVAHGFYDRDYTGLSLMVDGLGVRRLAATRGNRPKGTPPPPPDVERGNLIRDRSPEVVQLRGETLERTREMLLPGAVGDALGTRSGRLLVIPAMDTGTAPYAALPLRNGTAVSHWSFVILPDVDTLTGADPTFDYRALDIGKAIVVGNPDLSSDRKFDWAPLPGAQREAVMVSRELDDPATVLMTGTQATRGNLTRAIAARPDAGLVYLATHAVSDPRNPLTRGFIAMSGKEGHYYAGDIRQARFPDWKRHHPLVVISACQTALGRVFDGGGFGVARSWTTAGAGQVVASLWNVSDQATAILMTRFVERLKAGDVPEIAMQKAQFATMNARNAKGERPYANDPKMWASFMIFGKPSAPLR
ncbi:CHAT domain-containing protein [Novosphingobium aerophilum]|uniref:CHAT domain-containing protein n=1 Tax=Novosphingobium aerophilum TaxID=2839843 RepID=UPI003FD1E1CF